MSISAIRNILPGIASPNYVNIGYKIIARSIAHLANTAIRDRAEIDHHKMNYLSRGAHSAALQGRIGWINTGISLGSILLGGASLAVEEQYKAVALQVAQQAPSIFNCIPAHVQADASKESNKVSFHQMILQDTLSKKQAGAGEKQELSSMAQVLAELQKRAATSAG